MSSQTPAVEKLKLPTPRNGKVIHVHITDPESGSFSAFVTFAEAEDGQVAEFFIDAAKQGSTVRGMMHAWAILASNALQHHMPLHGFVRAMLGQTFQPKGATDDPDIPACLSIVDYIARRVALDYLTADECAALGVVRGEHARPTQGWS